MRNLITVRALLLIAVAFLSVHSRSMAAGSDAAELKQLVQQYLPGARLIPDAPAKPRDLMSASGAPLDLTKAGRESSQPRKGAGYWLTPTMQYLGRQHLAGGTTNDATGAVRLLLALTRGPSFVKQNTYRASPVEGGWVVEVEHDYAKFPDKIPAMPPYELLLDASNHVTQIRERCYTFVGSPVIYDRTVRAVYEREIKLNGAINYPAVLAKELAKEWETEKAQKTVK